jgi:hypothetical protein
MVAARQHHYSCLTLILIKIITIPLLSLGFLGMEITLHSHCMVQNIIIESLIDLIIESFYITLASAETRNNPNKETIFRNDEYRIGAGLAFTTQLLNVIANILDIRLPKRLSHG